MIEADSSPSLTNSVIGRLLDELSWVGKSIRDYRRGWNEFSTAPTTTHWT